MVYLRFKYGNVSICNVNDRSRDHACAAGRDCMLLGIEDPLKVPNNCILVDLNIFRAIKKIVPNFIKGVDPKWGEYGYCQTKRGMRIKLYESGSGATHECALNVLEEMERNYDASMLKETFGPEFRYIADEQIIDYVLYIL